MRSHTHPFYVGFAPEKLKFAREWRGLNKKELAEQAALPVSLLNNYENGKSEPGFESCNIMARILSVPVGFFSKVSQPLSQASLDQCHFRANSALSLAQKRKARNYGCLVFAIFAFLERQGIKFPEPALPQFQQPATEQALEAVALEFRQCIGLGLGPLHDLAALIESLGVRIILLPAFGLDGAATWIDGIPCMLINARCAASRLQFNYAHELAHLVLDEESAPEDLLLERRANRFAGAFLMPAPSYGALCPRRYRQGEFMKLKSQWHVSISAALYRGRQLGLLTESAYKSACMTRASLRKREEEEFQPSLPSLLAQGLEMIGRDCSARELAQNLGIGEAELLEIIRAQNALPAIWREHPGQARQASIFEFSQWHS